MCLNHEYEIITTMYVIIYLCIHHSSLALLCFFVTQKNAK